MVRRGANLGEPATAARSYFVYTVTLDRGVRRSVAKRELNALNEVLESIRDALVEDGAHWGAIFPGNRARSNPAPNRCREDPF